MAGFDFKNKVREASRVAKKLRAFIIGPSGAGKTTSALILAKGLTADSKGKVLALDSENMRMDLKKGDPLLGDFTWDVYSEQPEKVTPQLIKDFIGYAEKEGYEVLIIDSLSHAWQSVTESHSRMSGNSFTNWKLAKKPYNDMIRKMISSNIHIIMTGRSKQVYEQTTSDSGKKSVEKMGLSPQVEDNTSYEFDFVFVVNQDHMATMDKSEGGLFEDPLFFQITPATGEEMLDWLKEGEDPDLRRKKVFLSKVKEYIQGFDAAKIPEGLIKSDEEYLRMPIEALKEEGDLIKKTLAA